MCQLCDKAVIEMGILESDLPNLPYKLVEWECMAYGCKCHIRIRDYGVPPYYYWPVRIIRIQKPGYFIWRGGWVSAQDGYICSKHFKDYKKLSTNTSDESFLKKYIIDHIGTWNQHALRKYMASKITPIIKVQKVK